MATNVCGHIWSDSSSTPQHQQHLCAEQGAHATHVCTVPSCGATQ